MEQWHRAYAPRGARVIAVHVTGDGPPATLDEVSAAAERHALTLPIVLDDELRIAEAYGINGVPSRYIFDQALKLADAHFGVGGFADGEALVRALVEHGERSLAERAALEGREATAEPAEPQAQEDPEESCDQGAAVPAAKQPRLLVHPPARETLPAPVTDPAAYVAPVPADRVAGDSRGPYEAGAVWLELHGHGRVIPADGAPLEVAIDGTYRLQGSGIHHAGVVDFTLEGPLFCEAIQLEPGTAAA